MYILLGITLFGLAQAEKYPCSNVDEEMILSSNVTAVELFGACKTDNTDRKKCFAELFNSTVSADCTSCIAVKLESIPTRHKCVETCSTDKEKECTECMELIANLLDDECTDPESDIGDSKPE
jgi:hypothetical protein